MKICFYLIGIPVILDSPMVGQNLMNHVSYSVSFIVNNASTFQDLNTDIARQYLDTRTGPMSSTGMSQVEYFQKTPCFLMLVLCQILSENNSHIPAYFRRGPTFFSCESPIKLPLFIDN